MALPDNFTAQMDQTITGNVLADNGHGADYDVNGDSLSVVGAETFQTAHGLVTLNTDGSFTYNEVAGYTGTDSFNYTITDGTDTASATVSLTINPLPDAITGTDGRDVLIGHSGNNTILGLGGNDTLIGNNGDDHLYGGAGDDTLLGSNGNDVLVGGAGSDRLFGGNGNDVLVGGDAVIQYGADGQVQSVTPVATANDGNNTLFGGAGNDMLYAGSGHDTLFGGNGNDSLYAGSGNDKLFGGNGDDKLYTGTGTDTLIGGHGADSFILTAITNAPQLIEDFNVAQGDKLVLSDVIQGQQSAVQSAIDSFVHATTQGHDTVISVDTDGAANGAHFVPVAILHNVHDLDLHALVQSGNVVL